MPRLRVRGDMMMRWERCRWPLLMVRGVKRADLWRSEGEGGEMVGVVVPLVVLLLVVL